MIYTKQKQLNNVRIEEKNLYKSMNTSVGLLILGQKFTNFIYTVAYSKYIYKDFNSLISNARNLL